MLERKQFNDRNDIPFTYTSNSTNYIKILSERPDFSWSHTLPRFQAEVIRSFKTIDKSYGTTDNYHYLPYILR